ncbi:DUF6676 family protein [Antrihabitans sp. YC2-6]|uniref:Rv1476 family membrane protein n=1 Tax=Antrihabitans sp. YC2-6 TaxID=2799498 RepID=UPI001F1E3693|nr:DUF6676 family protein [Antrihabitans sp. YC2-6]
MRISVSLSVTPFSAEAANAGAVSAGAFEAAFAPAPAALPPDVDLDDVLADVATDHVCAPPAEVAAMTKVVAHAEAEGIDLTIIVVDKNPGHDSMLRDLATEVGKHEGGTVLVLSPDYVGTYSDSISRVQLETAEDPAKWSGGNSEKAANNFVNELSTYSQPWTAITCVILATTLAIVGGLYVVKTRRGTTPEEPAPTEHATID